MYTIELRLKLKILEYVERVNSMHFQKWKYKESKISRSYHCDMEKVRFLFKTCSAFYKNLLEKNPV